MLEEEVSILRARLEGIELRKAELESERNELAGRVSSLESDYGVNRVEKLQADNARLEGESRRISAENDKLREIVEGDDGLVSKLRMTVEKLGERLRIMLEEKEAAGGITPVGSPKKRNELSESFPEVTHPPLLMQQSLPPTRPQTTGNGGGSGEECHSAMLVKTLGNAARTAMQQVEVCRKEFRDREDVMRERIRVLEEKVRNGEGK